jgi:hypothetical protein
MILKSFGCSFIWGSDLPNSAWKPSFDTWPALLAKELGLVYRCHAWPGSGNLYIAKKILEHTKPNDVVIVQWTFVDRFDYQIESGEWKTIRPTCTNAVSQTYYQKIHSQYRDKLTSLIAIKTCIDHLKQLNCKFVMTYMDELLFETEWHSDPAIAALQNYVSPYMSTFDGNNMLEYSVAQGHPVSDNNHPLHSGHAVLFEYAKKNFLKELQ